MTKIVKVGIVAGAGIAVGGLVWYFTRPAAAAAGSAGAYRARTQSQLRALRGYTQGGSFDRPSVLAPVAQAGLQRILFRRSL